MLDTTVPSQILLRYCMQFSTTYPHPLRALPGNLQTPENLQQFLLIRGHIMVMHLPRLSGGLPRINQNGSEGDHGGTAAVAYHILIKQVISGKNTY